MKQNGLNLNWLLAIVLIVNGASLLNPIINEGDSVTYAALAQHMVAHHNWIDLVLDGKDWLDKPHFPFWVTAAFFELLGPSTFSYILAGFVFHLLGGYFVYRIARIFYGKPTALLSLLVFLSAYHVMYTSSAIKAEAFLTGTITGACFYWLRYDAQGRWKHLVLGAVFSAMSVMTKGIFTLMTIASGLVCMWLVMGQWRKMVSPKWLLALALTALFTAPELLALYLQFDAHPELVVFGRTQVSGIRFFLWDSQFGRFFNSGPIKNQGSSPLYYVHVFLWAFLPWVAVFFMSLWKDIKEFPRSDSTGRAYLVFLWASFFTTFFVFSASQFQLDYYTVILYPFAAILCGKYLHHWLVNAKGGVCLVVVQALVTLFVASLSFALAVYVGKPALLALVVVPLGVLMVYALTRGRSRPAHVVVAYPVVAVCVLYAFLEVMVSTTQQAYGVAYNVNRLLPEGNPLPVVAYQVDEIIPRELAIYRGMPYTAVNGPTQLPAKGSRYLLVIKDVQLQRIQAHLGHMKILVQGDWIDHKTGLLPRILSMAKGAEPLEKFSIVQVGE